MKFAREGGMSGRYLVLIEHMTGAAYFFSHWNEDGTPTLVKARDGMTPPTGAHIHVTPETQDANTERIDQWATTQAQWRTIGQGKPGLK